MTSWGRRSATTPVYLNIYDLAPGLNEYTHQFGLGVFHSGVEVHGVEWTFGAGSGVFSMAPKQVPGDQARFREQVKLGETNLSSREVEAIASEMKEDYPGSSYNVLTKNCNCFADDFTKRLLRKAIPGYVNRLAYLGSFLSCILPPEMLGGAPVDGAPSGSGSGTGSGSAAPRRAAAAPVFSGSGNTLDASSSGSGGGTAPSATPSAAAGGSETDAIRARREMLAAAAVARRQRMEAAAAASGK